MAGGHGPFMPYLMPRPDMTRTKLKIVDASCAPIMIASHCTPSFYIAHFFSTADVKTVAAAARWRRRRLAKKREPKRDYR